MLDTSNKFKRCRQNIIKVNDIKNMLKEMRVLSELLVTDYDDVALQNIKKYFSYSTFLPKHNCYNIDVSKEERQQVIRNNICIAKDFYDRFILRMEIMMRECSECDAIMFMGP